jgi:hypothetical protein
MGPYEREHADLISMIPDNWWLEIKQPRPDVSWEINKSAFVGNRLYSNYLGLRLLQENEVIGRHRDVIALAYAERKCFYQWHWQRISSWGGKFCRVECE